MFIISILGLIGFCFQKLFEISYLSNPSLPLTRFPLEAFKIPCFITKHLLKTPVPNRPLKNHQTPPRKILNKKPAVCFHIKNEIVYRNLVLLNN